MLLSLSVFLFLSVFIFLSMFIALTGRAIVSVSVGRWPSS